MPTQPTYRSHLLGHLGLIAGMCDALALGDVLDHATTNTLLDRRQFAGFDQLGQC